VDAVPLRAVAATVAVGALIGTELEKTMEICKAAANGE